jgi:hypothetical protein
MVAAQAHDPYKQIDYLQQCLSANKKPLGLFIGAGCPTAVRLEEKNECPLIPDILGITSIVRERLSSREICGPLLGKIDEHLQQDDRQDCDIEAMLGHIRALCSVAGKDDARVGLSVDDCEKLDDAICQIIQELADKELPKDGTPYHRVAEWVSGTMRDKPVEVFTANYDLLMEQAFEHCQVPFFDGFPGSCRPFFDIRTIEEDPLPSRWARLWKLHGSINWYLDSSKRVYRGTTDEAESKRVIHPSHMKYEESRRMPYLAMIDRLRTFIKQPTAALVVCGYSFRDEHINEVFLQGLQFSPTSIVFALLYDTLDKYPNALKLANECPNLSLLASDGAVVGSTRSEWPTREAESAVARSDKWITWATTEPEKEDAPLIASFQLGDFAVLGELFHEVGGSVSRPAEASN